MAEEVKKKEEPKKSYKLKADAKFQLAGEDVKPGDSVELTEAQYEAFKDKFEAPPETAETPAAATVPAAKTTTTKA